MSINNHIRNYYEQLVAEEIIRKTKTGTEVDYLADVACVALNHLPPRYIRYEVDMAFYTSPNELSETLKMVEKAVSDAIAFVDKHQRQD